MNFWNLTRLEDSVGDATEGRSDIKGYYQGSVWAIVNFSSV
jgi:hypothetical protein